MANGNGWPKAVVQSPIGHKFAKLSTLPSDGAGSYNLSVRMTFPSQDPVLNIEIERKYLVVGGGWRSAHGDRIVQGYLNTDPERTVRIRLVNRTAYLAVKGPTHGVSRREFEYEIPFADGERLLKMSEGSPIQKVRHSIAYQGSRWDVDEFLGVNAPLVLAEIELKSESQEIDRPNWLGQEVTGDARFYNSNLAIKPYSTWEGT
jgi:CYTH domain-containing protein